MVIGIIGENCSGKSTLAKQVKAAIGAEIVTGKDYLRMARSESEAAALFREKLQHAMDAGNIIYVISEPEHLRFLPEGAIRILVKADLETIKERFKARMRGNLPAPVVQMLEKKARIVRQRFLRLLFRRCERGRRKLVRNTERTLLLT